MSKLSRHHSQQRLCLKALSLTLHSRRAINWALLRHTLQQQSTPLFQKIEDAAEKAETESLLSILYRLPIN